MLQVDRKEAAATLRAVKAAVGRRPGIPALTGVLVEAANGRATFTSTDLEVSVRATIDAGGDAARFLVPFALFGEAVKSATGDTLTIDAGEARARIGGAEIRLLPAEDFPTLTIEAPYAGHVDAAAFVLGASSVEPASSGDQARPVLTGVLLELHGIGARMVATDSYRLHVAELEGSGDLRAIVPGRVIAAIGKQLGKKTAGIVTVAGGDSEVRFMLPDGVEITSRTIEGEYPNWQQLVPDRGVGTGVRYDQAELAGVIKSASAFSRAGYAPTVRLEIEPVGNVVKLSASSPDLGQYAADLEHVDVWGEPITFALNPSYFAGAVSAIGEGGSFEIRDALKPATFRSSDGNRTALVMPVRL